MRSLFAATLALAAASGSAFLLPIPPTPATRSSAIRMAAEQMDRRDALARSAAGAALAILGVAGGLGGPAVAPVRAAEEVPLVRDTMGGLLTPYTDIPKVHWRCVGVALGGVVRCGGLCECVCVAYARPTPLRLHLSHNTPQTPISIINQPPRA